jgi:hypothetical protein
LPTLSEAVRGASPASGESSEFEVLSEQATDRPAAMANKISIPGCANRFIMKTSSGCGVRE